jgi:hypothetical protein
LPQYKKKKNKNPGIAGCVQHNRVGRQGNFLQWAGWCVPIVRGASFLHRWKRRTQVLWKSVLYFNASCVLCVDDSKRPYW